MENDRRESSGWLGRGWAFCKAVVFVIAPLSVLLFWCADVHLQWTPLQRYYCRQYIEAWMQEHVAVKASNSTSNWDVLEIVDRKGVWHDSFSPAAVVVGETRAGKTVVPLALSDAAKDAGAVRLRVVTAKYNNAEMRAWLRRWVFDDRGFRERARPAELGGLAVLVLGFCIAWLRDRKRNSERTNGRRLRGPELVSVRRFNRRLRSDGVGFALEQTWLDRLLKRTRMVNIPSAAESSGILMGGDTGTGKSTLMRMLALQIEARDECAIICDFGREFTRQFYKPERGDVILNGLDRRMPYWNPSAEISHPAEALTLATALFPDREGQGNVFFPESSRQIFAHLTTLGMSLEELIDCLCRPEEVDRRVAGTAHAQLIAPTAPAQRAGVLASLSKIAPSLQLLPRRDEASLTWTASSWSKNPKGWIFLTSLHKFRDSLRPLTSMWLDMLILHLMNEGMTPGHRRVWLLLDELRSMHKLPQLHTALTENRKTGNPVVIGFQGKSQLEELYGTSAEVMLSQPATKIFMRSGEPRSAQWVADGIGKEEFERQRESRTDGRFPGIDQRRSRSDTHEQQERYVVMPSEIGGLPNRHAYMKHGNLVVKMSFPYMPVRDNQPEFLERPVRSKPAPPPPDATPNVDVEFSSSSSSSASSAARPSTSPRPAMGIEPEPFFE